MKISCDYCLRSKISFQLLLLMLAEMLYSHQVVAVELLKTVNSLSSNKKRRGTNVQLHILESKLNSHN